jgi:CBS domain-containing protein
VFCVQPLLELIRGGFLRFILTPGSTQPGWDATKASGATVTTVPRRAIACHRVAIYRLDYDPAVRDDTMCIDAVLSQSDVIRLLNKHLDDLGDVTSKSLHDIGLGGDWDDGSDPGAGAGVVPGDEVTCVLPTASALEAFSLMNAWGLSAVGVVSEPRGPLVDCLSVSDLRGVKAGDFTSLDASVSEFRKRGRMAGANPIDPAPVTVRPDADLGEVISKMCDRGVHRVFVTDLEGRPVRMITPTDILRSITMPAMHSNVGWRFQAAEISSKYARSRDGVEREAEPTRVDDGRKFHDEM